MLDRKRVAKSRDYWTRGQNEPAGWGSWYPTLPAKSAGRMGHPQCWVGASSQKTGRRVGNPPSRIFENAGTSRLSPRFHVLGNPDATG